MLLNKSCESRRIKFKSGFMAIINKKQKFISRLLISVFILTFKNLKGDNKLKKFMFLFVLCLIAFNLTGEFAVEYAYAAPESAAGFITMQFDLSDHPLNDEVKLWIPYPVSSRYQTISDIQVKGDYTESGVYTDKKFQTPILYARWKGGAKSRKLTFKFYAERIEAIHRNFPAKAVCWNKADYAMWLSPSSIGPVKGAVKDLADQITKGKTGVLAKARAIYDWTCENMYRDPDTIGCGRGDVLKLLKKPGGKCTDIHSVFVALCRAAAVPAREIFGIRMGKKPVVDITKWEHCWAEFYLPGYGWVPVDPADVRKKMLRHNLTLKDMETEKWRRYFWGAWDQYRIQLSVGRDIRLNPAQKGKPLNNFGYPYAEINGKSTNWYSPATFKYKIIFHKK